MLKLILKKETNKQCSIIYLYFIDACNILSYNIRSTTMAVLLIIFLSLPFFTIFFFFKFFSVELNVSQLTTTDKLALFSPIITGIIAISGVFISFFIAIKTIKLQGSMQLKVDTSNEFHRAYIDLKQSLQAIASLTKSLNFNMIKYNEGPKINKIIFHHKISSQYDELTSLKTHLMRDFDLLRNVAEKYSFISIVSPEYAKQFSALMIEIGDALKQVSHLSQTVGEFRSNSNLPNIETVEGLSKNLSNTIDKLTFASESICNFLISDISPKSLLWHLKRKIPSW